MFVAAPSGGGGLVAIKRPREGVACPAGGGEEFWLRECNSLGVGPQLVASARGAVAMAFVPGTSLGEALDRATPRDAAWLQRAIADALAQCARLDAARVCKSEMHRCQRHWILAPTAAAPGEDNGDGESSAGREEAALRRERVAAPAIIITAIDFERCSRSEKPRNVTGFAQYLSSSWVRERLAHVGLEVDVEALRAATGDYKRRGCDQAALRGVSLALGLPPPNSSESEKSPRYSQSADQNHHRVDGLLPKRCRHQGEPDDDPMANPGGEEGVHSPDSLDSDGQAKRTHASEVST